MNRQRLLWVILSITLLVIIVLAGGLWLLRSAQPVPVSEVNRQPLTEYDRFEYPNTNYGRPLFTDSTQSVEKQEVTIGQQDEGSLISSLTDESQKSTAPLVTTKPSPSPSPSAAPAKQTTKKTSAATTTAKTQTKTPAKPVPVYWIQTGSYKSKSKADQCNEILVSNGLTGRIVTKKINNETYFRVRIGPFGNKGEAEKFLAWIKEIEGLEESYIAEDFSVKN